MFICIFQTQRYCEAVEHVLAPIAEKVRPLNAAKTWEELR